MFERYLVAKEERRVLVVMASTTWVVMEAGPPFIFFTSSLIPDRPAFRETGKSRLSIRYCLSEDRSRPELSLRNLRRYS